MRLRIIYGLIGAIVGFLIAFFVSIFFFYMTIAILWMYVYGNNPWPHWVEVSLPFVFFGPFLIILNIILIKGVLYGGKLNERPDIEEVTKKAKQHLKISLIGFLIFCLIFAAGILVWNKNVKASQIKKEQYDALVASLDKVENISLSQNNDNLEIAVDVSRQSQGKYQLTVDLAAAGFAQCQLLAFIKEIPSISQDKTYHFKLSFTDLAKAYRKELVSYVPNFDKPIDIDERIQVSAKLSLLENKQYNSLVITSFKLPQSEKSGTAMFYFSCEGENCKIIQSKDSSR